MATIDIKSAGGGGSVATGVLQLLNGVALDATLRSVTDQSNTLSPLKLSTSLVQSTSTLKITTNDNPYIDAEDGAGNNRFTVGRATSSQQVNVDFASNPAGSTTAVGAIRTFRDGTNLSEAMTFIEDGSVGIGTTAPVGLLDLFKSAAATRLAIRGDAGQNRLISYRTGALQRFGLYVNNTAESGSNAGSNFAIRAYDDAGTLLSTPLFINRASGNVGFGTTSPTNAVSIERTTGDSVLSLQGNATTFISVSRFSNNTERPRLELYKSRGTIATPLVVQTGDELGSVDFYGYDGSANQRVGILFVNAESVAGSTITPQMAFGLGTSAGTNSYKMVIKNDGNITIGNDTTTLGARLGIKGSGSTAATTSLLIQNSGGTQLLKFTDDASLTIAAGGTADFLGNVSLRGVVDSGNASNNLRFVAAGATKSVLINADYSNSNDASAMLEVQSTTKGFLPPRMTTAEKNAIATPAAGLMVYDTTLNKLCVRTAAAWETITSI